MVEQAIAAASQAAGAAASLVQYQAQMGRDVAVAAVAAAAHVVPPQQQVTLVPTALPVPTPVVAAGKPAKLPENAIEAMMKSLAHYEKRPTKTYSK